MHLYAIIHSVKSLPFRWTWPSAPL